MALQFVSLSIYMESACFRNVSHLFETNPKLIDFIFGFYYGNKVKNKIQGIRGRIFKQKCLRSPASAVFFQNEKYKFEIK